MAHTTNSAENYATTEAITPTLAGIEQVAAIATSQTIDIVVVEESSFGTDQDIQNNLSTNDNPSPAAKNENLDKQINRLLGDGRQRYRKPNRRSRK